MGNRIADDFNRPNGPLGSTPNGFVWRVLRGTASIAAGRAVAALLANGSHVAIDVGLDGQDGRVSLDMGGVGGDAVLWRVTDDDNFFRAALHRFTETVVTGTEQYIIRYDQVQIGSRQVYVGEEQYISGYEQVYVGQDYVVVGYSPTEYQYVQTYGGFVGFDGTHHGNTSQNHGNIAPLYAWSSNPNLTEISHETYSHPHSHTAVPGSFTTSHYVPANSSAQRTGATRGGEPIYGYQPRYESRPIYATRSVYRDEPVYEQRAVYGTRNVSGTFERADLVVHKRQAGTPVLIRTERLPDNVLTTPGVLSVAFDGETHTVMHPVTRGVLFSFTDPFNRQATQHGFGSLGTSYTATTVTAPNTDGIDGWVFDPARGGLYVPTLMR